MAADGYTPASIKRYLNENGVKTVGGAEWIDSTVFRLIENEIYKGDYIMHKHFVNEERKLVRNRGEVDAWYIEDDHEAIVSPKLWQKAQDALEAKRDYLAEGSVIEEFTEENYPYMNKKMCIRDSSKTFEVKYTPIDLLVPFKLLIKDGDGKLYTVENQIINEELSETADVLVRLEETEVNALLFKKHGFAKMPEWDLIKGLTLPSVLSWSDSRAFPLNAVITGTPDVYKRQVPAT